MSKGKKTEKTKRTGKILVAFLLLLIFAVVAGSASYGADDKGQTGQGIKTGRQEKEENTITAHARKAWRSVKKAVHDSGKSSEHGKKSKKRSKNKKSPAKSG